MTLPILRRAVELRRQVATWHRAGERVALVPTMGALHAGHLALCAAAKARAQRVVVSLFVNPRQFDRPDDLARYPRNEAGDAALLDGAGVDLLFAPPVDEVYPPGFATTVVVAGLDAPLCGRNRPGHFTGMATVVAKLLSMAGAEVALFGEKDYQQLLIVKRLTRDLDLPVEIVGVPTLREADGLALSSRNRRLSVEQRRLAPLLYRTLCDLAAALADGRPAESPLQAAARRLRAAGFRLDYLELRHDDDLRPLTRAESAGRLFVAAWLGEVRLIDNLAVA